MLLDPLTIGPSDLSSTFGVLGPTGILRARRLQDHWATLGLLNKRTLGVWIMHAWYLWEPGTLGAWDPWPMRPGHLGNT